MRKLETKTMHDEDVTIYLTESQWRGLLRRYDEEMIHKDSGLFHITVPCMLCATFYNYDRKECGACPLEPVGCLNLTGIHGSEALSSVTSSRKIEWLEDMDEDVRKGIRNLRKVLLGMPRTRRV